MARRLFRDGLLGIGLLVAILGLLRYPQEAMGAVREGLTLCGNVIIPSLFPFFVLSTLVVDLGLAGYLGRWLSPIMSPLFRLPGCCGCALALGFVGGYPVGARTAIDLYQKGFCTKTEAERLLSFCNNSGPAFILGVVGTGIFASSKVGLLLHLTHGLASVVVGLLFRFYGKKEGSTHGRPPQFKALPLSSAFTGSVQSALTATLNICAFVIFFTVVIRMLFHSGFLPLVATLLGTALTPLGVDVADAQRLLTGVLEVSSGVWSLRELGTTTTSLSLAAFMLGWAGLSVHCQVLCFLNSSGLSAKTYILGKLLHGGLSALFVSILYRILPFELSVSTYLHQQVDTLTDLDFATAFALTTTCAWLIPLLFLLFIALILRKSSSKSRKFVV